MPLAISKADAGDAIAIFTAAASLDCELAACEAAALRSSLSISFVSHRAPPAQMTSAAKRVETERTVPLA